MRPIDKTAFDLFQKLRARYSPITLGDEEANATSDPKEARYFNFWYVENDQKLGPVAISLIDNDAMKVFYSEEMTHDMVEKAKWYSFLKELRGFAKRNLLTFDARDLSKNQLGSKEFKWMSDQHGKVDKDDVAVTESENKDVFMKGDRVKHRENGKTGTIVGYPEGEEYPVEYDDEKGEAHYVDSPTLILLAESNMFGSKRRSYQTLESVKLIVQHSKTVDEDVPGARSRSIQGIYLERADGERYKFPYNYLTGARAMARHISEGGNPYDPMGQNILGMIKEMRDLSKFARMTKSHAMEDAEAGSIREKVVERYQNLKSVLSSMSDTNGYKSYSESFSPTTEISETGNDIEQLRERFTRRVWDTAMEELLPSVQRALKGANMNDKIHNGVQKVRNAFQGSIPLSKLSPKYQEGFKRFMKVMRAKFPDVQAELSNKNGNASLRISIGRNWDSYEEQKAVNEFATKCGLNGDGSMNALHTYVTPWPQGATGHGFKKVKEADQFEGWANNVTEGLSDSSEIAQNIIASMAPTPGMSMEDIYGIVKNYLAGQDSDYDIDEIAQIVMDHFGLDEATTQGTVGTVGPTGTVNANGQQNPQQQLAQMQQGEKNALKMANQGAGMQVSGGDMGKLIQSLMTGQQIPQNGAKTMLSLGSQLVQNAAQDPRKATALTNLLRRMRQNQDVAEEFNHWYNNIVTEKEIQVVDDNESMDGVDPAASQDEPLNIPSSKSQEISEMIAVFRKLSGIQK